MTDPNPWFYAVKMARQLLDQEEDEDDQVGDSFGVVKFCSLRGEGRRGWEG